MEENSKENNKNVECDDYPDELREIPIAGFALIQCKYSKMRIDSQTEPNHLNRGKFRVDKKFVEASLDKWFVLNLKVPEHGKPIDGLPPPKHPPVNSLQGRLGKCGDPFEKQLTMSDVKEDQSRLTITKDLVQEFIDPVMNEEEKEFSRKVDGILVMVFDAKGNQYQMTFKRWGGNIQVLTSGWKAFCNKNEFKAHQDWITIWACRHYDNPEQLCFVILARRFPGINHLVPRKQSGNKRENRASDHIPRNKKIKQTD